MGKRRVLPAAGASTTCTLAIAAASAVAIACIIATATPDSEAFSRQASIADAADRAAAFYGTASPRAFASAICATGRPAHAAAEVSTAHRRVGAQL